ncbi:hypothetical protein GCM10011452_23080 [Gemmobacter lanyuensis]|uniref:MOSC domain-containing protein n=1 Tax=Gemmobacter lanyuensis TaxID=1054497 RepID=A0A918IV43_9RHOB|nr:hypothetical protein [Gemmobacter lanyuensis]GGW33890.1 hypothetical protein GCM10011452_23080 [Gemmobacter lanyuensis]
MTPVSLDELMTALPHVLAAPKDDTPILQLCFRPAFNQRSFPESLTITPEEGVPGERFTTAPWLKLPDGSGDPRIQVSILPSRVMDLVWRDRAGTPHPGDTIIADLDTSLANLPDGTLLQAGSAILRVSDVFNDGCVKWKARYGADAKAWITAPGHPELRLRGVLCSVAQGGEMRVGDRLKRIG